MSVLHPAFAGLERTEKLYHSAPDCDAITARVIAVNGNQVVLDKTLFYAEAGGQVADRGTLGGHDVIAVKKAGGTPVKIERAGLDPIWVATDTLHVHELADGHGLETGAEVELALDRAHRDVVRLHHSAAHFLYIALREVLARREEAIFTKGCHIDMQGFRFDLGNDIDAEQVAEVEAIANAQIAQGLAISMATEDSADDVFYWTYGTHIIPCGGTHVATARALSPIGLKRRSKGKSTLRVSGSFAG
jgi:alanyl-tRNA synthetase